MRLFFSRLLAFKKFEVIWTTRAELTILSVNLTFAKQVLELGILAKGALWLFFIFLLFSLVLCY